MSAFSALNEEDAILRVLNDIPDLAHEVIVVDNGSMDDTPARAAAAGSIGFCPPCAVRLLPINTTVATAKNDFNSPVLSTSNTSGFSGAASIAVRRATFNFVDFN